MKRKGKFPLFERGVSGSPRLGSIWHSRTAYTITIAVNARRFVVAFHGWPGQMSHDASIIHKEWDSLHASGPAIDDRAMAIRIAVKLVLRYMPKITQIFEPRC